MPSLYISALVATQATCRSIHNHLQNCFLQTTMPVCVTLEHAGSSDLPGSLFIVSVSFSLACATPRTSRMLSLVECTSPDSKQLYARTTGGVLRALQIGDWRSSWRVRKYKRCIRIALRESTTIFQRRSNKMDVRKDGRCLNNNTTTFECNSNRRGRQEGRTVFKGIVII